ncbi:MAG: histidine kinase dimerization/phospho-acceptor domain-containing protein, partial [Kiloniellales bacterium]|nr:histidine kinase dimerization/phospho-acceptor domain-containing protein [Kiloniellales bacterium]
MELGSFSFGLLFLGVALALVFLLRRALIGGTDRAGSGALQPKLTLWTVQNQNDHSLLDCVPEALALIARDGTIRYVNKAACQLFRCKAVNLADSNIASIAVMREDQELPVSRSEERDFLGHLLALEGQPAEGYLGCRLDGSTFSLRLSCAVEPAGGQRSFVVCLRNIDEIEHANRLLQQSEKKDKADWLPAGLAHEFNNILAIVSGNAELLEHRYKCRDLEQPLELAAIQQATGRGIRMAESLLNFSRENRHQPQPIDPAKLLRKVKSLAAPVLKGNVILSLEVSPNLPMILGDPTELEGAVLNLILNARDAIRGDGQIALSAQLCSIGEQDEAGLTGIERSPYLLFEVRDTGIGMTAYQKARAFDPYFTTKPIGKGT